ncbi:MAG: ATP-dependent nuclease [Smithella sp.]
MLSEIKLINFRCFSEHVVPLKQTSIIIGRNNAGKSTVVEAIRLVAIVATRYKSLSYKSPVDWPYLPKREIGVSPSLKGMEFNFRTIFHRYGDPPSIIIAKFDNDNSIKIYIGEEGKIHAVIYNSQGTVIRSRSEANSIDIPRVEIMPQIAPVSRNEVVLTEDYVKSAISSSLAPLHFRNQLKILKEHVGIFKEMAENTWPGLQIRELDYGRGYLGDSIQLSIRDEDFVAELSLMGHGLQMWLQTMWFLARSSQSATVILDEPDVYMHPDLQRRLIRYIKNRYNQIIITTHSVEIMSEVDADEILIIDRKNKKSRYAGTLPAVQRIIEHIGSVHNINLARLWHSRRCILVEGKDIKLLNEIHRIIFPEKNDNLSASPHMSIGGWGCWNYAIGSSMLLKNSGGQSIIVYCILDSDFFPKAEIKKRLMEARNCNVNLHIWKYKEIENYFIQPAAIQRVINSQIRKRIKAPTIKEVSIQIEVAIDELKDSTLDAISTEILSRDKGLGAGGANKIARQRIDEAWKTQMGRIGIVSGKELFSSLSKWSQDNYSVSLSPALVARNLYLSEISDELKYVVSSIENIELFHNMK